MYTPPTWVRPGRGGPHLVGGPLHPGRLLHLPARAIRAGGDAATRHKGRGQAPATAGRAPAEAAPATATPPACLGLQPQPWVLRRLQTQEAARVGGARSASGLVELW